MDYRNGKMRGAKMPQERFEKDAKQAPVSGEKYSTEFGNPEALDRMTEGLAKYVKNHPAKHD